jgi:hypothetical protein
MRAIGASHEDRDASRSTCWLFLPEGGGGGVELPATVDPGDAGDDAVDVPRPVPARLLALQLHDHSSLPPLAARHRQVTAPYGHPATPPVPAVQVFPAIGCVPGQGGGGVSHSHVSPPAAPIPRRQPHVVVP